MTTERSALIAYVRGELVGPSVPMREPEAVAVVGGHLQDPKPGRRGALAWRPTELAEPEEILYFDGETPHRKYGVGLLHPESPGSTAGSIPPEKQAALETDTQGVELSEVEESPAAEAENDEPPPEGDPVAGLGDAGLDFDVSSPDVRRPSTMAISCYVRVGADGALIVRLPRERRFVWQVESDRPFPVNGRYERLHRTESAEGALSRDSTAWGRVATVPVDCTVSFTRAELAAGEPILRGVEGLAPKGPSLHIELFPRAVDDREDHYLVTVALRNRRPTTEAEVHEATLYQTFFDVAVENGTLVPYPENRRASAGLDDDEQSLALLYRDSRTWAIGHGCAAGWDAAPGTVPTAVYADVMPAVELPSMTPDIRDAAGNVISLRMRDLAELSDDGLGAAWGALEALATEYELWIARQRDAADDLPLRFEAAAARHLALCSESLDRIRRGIGLLRTDADARTAFRLANLSMLLQQIATKQVRRRPVRWDRARNCAVPTAPAADPWRIYAAGEEKPQIGRWRAFQLAFLLMQLEGVGSELSVDRSVIDLIWFPTGGGKTEAYLGVMSFLLWHQRLLMLKGAQGPARDGTNVIMRYTLRMLTTQQFQRAASLICAMEALRRNPSRASGARVPGRRFSLGLWIGGDATPNSIEYARQAVGAFKSGKVAGNPLVLTECPWCRTEIGRCDAGRGNRFELAGISTTADGPMLLCVDPGCEFGQMSQSSWLPVEVIDERIYDAAPSVVIATADKFAMMAYRPEAGIILGRGFLNGEAVALNHPPSLIVQDELHLISGPLGTMYGLYEAVIERLCSLEAADGRVMPKIIASTATIRGAEAQTLALYGRERPVTGGSNVRLFPSPGLEMGDSFFGVHARRPDGTLDHGRLYLGLHASNYGSILTTQVRAFSSLLCRPTTFDESPDARDPWWTLLGFYNSIRELGGARTLFDSDIRSRLKFLQNREGLVDQARRNLRVVEELTSRLSQSEIVGMMDRLAAPYGSEKPVPIDGCLASSIIEVGVDIDRLSLLSVVGQPKSTAQYIQVTGRVGRRWESRPGLIVTLFSPGKSRDRSHFEQFHSYHRRLYERVEPTTATPFALSSIQRALPGALILWARQRVKAPVADVAAYRNEVIAGCSLMIERCRLVQRGESAERSIRELERMRDVLLEKWSRNPAEFESFPPDANADYLMLWPGQYRSAIQERNGIEVPSSLRQVDRSGELTITDGYALGN